MSKRRRSREEREGGELVLHLLFGISGAHDLPSG